MNRAVLYLVCILTISSCGSAAFVEDLQGTWKVMEVNYIYDSSTSGYYPTDQFFVFDDHNYQHQQNGTVDESGTFYVNPGATVIIFDSTPTGGKYDILEKSATHQHWRSKNKILGFYLDFKLEKVQ